MTYFIYQNAKKNPKFIGIIFKVENPKCFFFLKNFFWKKFLKMHFFWKFQLRRKTRRTQNTRMLKWFNKEDETQRVLHSGRFYWVKEFHGDARGTKNWKIISRCCGLEKDDFDILIAGNAVKSKTVRPSHFDTRLLSGKGHNYGYKLHIPWRYFIYKKHKKSPKFIIKQVWTLYIFIYDVN